MGGTAGEESQGGGDLRGEAGAERQYRSRGVEKALLSMSWREQGLSRPLGAGDCKGGKARTSERQRGQTPRAAGRRAPLPPYRLG